MVFFSCRVSLLGVLCLLLLATSAYGNIDCPAIKHSVESILSIGPWNNGLAVLTTDLQLYNGKLVDKGKGTSSLRLQLSSPESLASREPKLYAFLLEQKLSSFANLIQVNSPASLERLILLANQTVTWLLNPSNGHKESIGVAKLPADSVWLSSESLDFYAVTGESIQMAHYATDDIHVDTIAHFLLCTGRTVRADQSVSGSSCWQVKRAFHWQGNFYILTTDSVYYFDDDALFHEVALFKVPYDTFFNCTDSKEEEETTIESRKTKDETIKSKVTRAHSTTSFSPVTTTPRWLNILLFTFFGICLLCIVVWVSLCVCWMPKKKAPLKGGRVFLPGDISFDGGLVHIPSKSEEPKVAVPRSPKASPVKGTKTAFNSALTKRSISPTKEQGPALRVATKMNPEMVKKIAARKALKRASSGQSGLKGKGDSCRQVKSATAIKTK